MIACRCGLGFLRGKFDVDNKVVEQVRTMLLVKPAVTVVSLVITKAELILHVPIVPVMTHSDGFHGMVTERLIFNKINL